MKVSYILSDESKWTKNTLARNSSGLAVPPLDENAVCWCLQGAIIKSVQICPGDVYDNQEYNRIQDKVAGYVIKKQEIWYTNWNDKVTTSFQDIQKMLKELDL